MKIPSLFFVALFGWATGVLLHADSPPAVGSPPAVDLVFIGDSITMGIGVPDPATQAAPVIAAQDLQNLLGAGTTVFESNQGQNGHTTVNFLPGGPDFTGVENAAKQLEASHPGQLIFSIMLGTNDSANSGTTGAPVSADDYAHNLKQIIDKLLLDYPNAKFVLNCPIWYSPNTHNGADYEGNSAANRLKSYFTAIDSVVSTYAASPPNQIFVGDTAGYNYFSIHFQTELNGQNGQNGTFFLHPNVKGAQSLGKFWADALLKVLRPQAR
jgi:lysophospholipase L1-like esterase